MPTLVVIIVAAIVSAALIGVLIWVVAKRTQHKEGSSAHVGAIGMEGIVIETKRKTSITGGLIAIPSPPELQRAQKFRERARTTVVGTPQFKFSLKKTPKKDLYHPALLGSLDFMDMEKGNAAGLPPMPPNRRVSEDRTTHTSALDDVSSTPEGGGGSGRGGGGILAAITGSSGSAEEYIYNMHNIENKVEMV